MKITNLAISYRTSIIVLTAVLIVGGLYSYVSIPKEAQPSIEIPNIVVTTIYPGASPNDIETLLTQPIEQEIQGINGIKEIRSTSTEGVSTVVIEFEPEVSIDDAFQKTRDKVDLAKAELPSDVEEPIVSEIDLTQFPILTINLASNYSLARLKEVAEDLKDELELIPTVLEIDLVGGLEQEVQVNVNLSALQGYNLTFNDVIDTIFRENTNIPGGSVDVDRLNYLVRVDGELENPEEIKELIIDAPGGAPIYIRDVADVQFGFKDRATYARLEMFKMQDEAGELQPISEELAGTFQVVSLNVKKRSGENILDTVADVKEKLAAFPFPTGTQHVITGDYSKYVKAMVKDLENNIISGLFFVVAVLLFFLGVRNAFLVGIAIPLSMFISFIYLQAAGYTLNFIILFSLIIALGMLVDNAIVIVENIYRYREMGYSRFEAARLGTSEVGTAVVASTATTVAAFAPMLFWPGIFGEFMGYLPLTLIVTLSCSLFVAIIINPVITGIFMRLESEASPERSRRYRFFFALTILVLALIIGLANWKTLVVLGIAIPLSIFLHRIFFKPVGDRFIQQRLPRLIERYRKFLGTMLERDYSKPRGLLRNMFSLVSFTMGILLLILGAIIGSTLGTLSGQVLLFPGMLLAGLGAIGILFHTFETLLGILLKRSFILTDNRSKLLNFSLGLLVIIFVLYSVSPTGSEFFPTTDPNQIMVNLEAPLGTNLETSDRMADIAHERISELLNDQPVALSNVENVLANVGVGGDAMFGGGAAATEASRLTLNLVDYEDRGESSKQTLASLRDQLQGIPGVKIEFNQDAMGPPVSAPVNIEITGEDFNEIVRIASEISDMLVRASESGEIQGLVDITDDLNTGRPELSINIDREKAARFGLSTRDIASTIRAAINGTEAGTFRTGEDEYDIIVRLSEQDRSSLESLNNLTILYEGEQIPLVAVANTNIQGGFGSVTRLDLSRTVTVSGNAGEGVNGNALLAQVQSYLADYQNSLPEGYSMSYTGENTEQAESFSFLGIALLIGVALIFMIMVAQFNSISSPFIIMVAVGLSLTGVMLTLVVTRNPFGIMTFIGVISLAGIIVNNNIVLIDYIMQLRDKGMEKQQAIIEGGATRLRPVLLTALTTVLGLIPLTIGLNVDFVGLLTDFDPNFQLGSQNTQFWGPMGLSIISGLSFATFLTLVIVPVMYSAFDSLSLRLSKKETPTEGEVAILDPSAGDGDNGAESVAPSRIETAR